MADPVTSVAPTPVSAQVVGNAFVLQYYQILHQSPELAHRFYKDISKLGRPDEDGSMSVTTTMDGINAKILSLNYGDFKAEIKFVDAQESLDGGVCVLVTGCLTGTDNITQQFTQYFFLAPQEKGYFVLNDMFRYMNGVNHHEDDEAPTKDVMIAPVTLKQEGVPVLEINIPVKAAILTEESQAEETVLVEKGEVLIGEEDHVPEAVDEVQDSSPLAVVSNTKTEVMHMKQEVGVLFSSPAPTPKKPQPRKQKQPLNNVVPTIVAAEPVASNVDVDAVENRLHEEEVEGYSVYIKHLPLNATSALLEEEFKKFGPIKTNGIQVIKNRVFSFAFVEFEVPDAVQKAIEASPVLVGGIGAFVEKKRSTNSRGGRGPRFRNDVMRGRGNFDGGRGGNQGIDAG